MQHTVPLGVPAQTGYPHYGVFQPALDCFLLTLPDRDLAHEICRLASSRFPLFVCSLDRADNYHPTLIDNTCCENWSIGSGTAITAGEPAQVRYLRARRSGLPDARDAKAHVMRIYYWCAFFDFVIANVYQHYAAVMFVREMWAQDANDHYQRLAEIRTMSRQDLYFGRDETQIQQRIDSWPELAAAQQEFHQWWR